MTYRPLTKNGIEDTIFDMEILKKIQQLLLSPITNAQWTVLLIDMIIDKWQASMGLGCSCIVKINTIHGRFRFSSARITSLRRFLMQKLSRATK